MNADATYSPSSLLSALPQTILVVDRDLNIIQTSGELKTKPTQHSVRELQAIGIQPDVILCRTDRDLRQDIKAKISLFTNVPLEAVITAKDVDNVYEIPLHYARENLDRIILKQLKLPQGRRNLARWKTLVNRMKTPGGEVNIALVGKYAGLQDSYMSLNQALYHGGIAHRLKVNISWIEAEDIEAGKPEEILADADGILVPGGFGVRGIEGKIKAVTYARKKKVPFFGICLGMQAASIEYARNASSLKNANSTEFNKETSYPVIYLMEKWYDFRTRKIQKRDVSSDKGGTMRLGAYPCVLVDDSKALSA